MEVGEKIVEALKDIAPCYAWAAYDGSLDDSKDKYFVYNYSTMPVFFADDEPPFEQYSIQLHFFCPFGVNTIAIRRKVKKAIYNAGFSFPSEEIISGNSRSSAPADEGQHYCFEFLALSTVNEGDESGGAF